MPSSGKFDRVQLGCSSHLAREANLEQVIRRAVSSSAMEPSTADQPETSVVEEAVSHCTDFLSGKITADVLAAFLVAVGTTCERISWHMRQCGYRVATGITESFPLERVCWDVVDSNSDLWNHAEGLLKQLGMTF